MSCDFQELSADDLISAAHMSLSRLRLAVPSTPSIPSVPDVPALPAIPELSTEGAQRPVSADPNSPHLTSTAAKIASPPVLARVRLRD